MNVVCLPGEDTPGGLIVDRAKKTITLWQGEFEISACLHKEQWAAFEEAVSGNLIANQFYIETPVKNETYKVTLDL